jgi:D-tyrosyl-tRNA(Tyr) deacylase
MRLVAQRVSSAGVAIGGKTVARIADGLCLLLGVAPDDAERDADVLAAKIANLRIFEDEAGKMNRSLLDVEGAALVVSQFTLFADCRKGRRPSFTDAAPPALGERLYRYFAERLRTEGVAEVRTGVFGAEMRVEIVNEGPVTILLDSGELAKRP